MLDGFLSLIGSIISLGAIFKEDYRKNITTSNNKYDAQNNKKKMYYDGDNYLRAVNTNEKVYPTYCPDGHTKYVGIKSGIVYHDTLTDINNKLTGKKYIYKEYPNGKYSTKLWKYDIEEQMPYTEKMVSLVYKDWIPAIELCYYTEINKDGSVNTFGKKVKKKIYMTDKEYEFYK